MTERFRAAFDGGARGNPGAAAWGVVVLAADGSPLEGHAGLLGNTTNNVAEYNGLIEALKLAAEAGAAQVEIITDSELIARQIEGRYRVKNEGLKPLFAKAKRLIAGFALFRIRHVRREQNKEADRLVNKALNLAEAGGGDVRLRESYESEPAGG
jgi:ribonuclease HI